MKKYLFMIGVLLLPITANAANANIDITSSSDKVNTGSTITVTANVNSSSPIGYYEYTLDYDHNKLELTNGNSYNVEHANNGETKSFKKDFKFKVKESSSTKISVKSYDVSSYGSNESMSVTVKPLTINSANANNTSGKSDNNNLSSLEIDGYKLEPSFNKSTTSYIVDIEDDISDVNIIAKAENSNATVTGTGKHSLKTGNNRIEIVVTSESGKDKTYTIRINLKEKNPIIVKIDGKEYTVMKSIESLNKIKGYKVTKVRIDDKDVEALYSDTTNLTLVGLKDENGTAKLYIYDADNDSFVPYNELSSENISILPIKPIKKLSNYSLYTETIDNNDIDCYKISSSSKFCAIYAMNLTNGKKGWYLYDLEENTIQRYNDDINNFYKDKMKNTRKLIYILSGTTLLFGVMTIGFAIKSGRKR